MKEQSAAILTIKEADKMTKPGRKAIAAWLRKQADFFQKHGDQYSRKYTARYLYR